MSFQPTLYTALLLASAFISGTVFMLSLKRRGDNPFLAFAMAAAFVWTFASGLESAAVGIPLKAAFAKVSFLGTSGVGPFLLMFALGFSADERRKRLLAPALLSAWPVASAALLATNELHGLMWSAILPSPVAGANMVQFVHTPLFYAAIGYDALLSVAAAAILLRAIARSHRLFRRQVFTVVAAIAVFWASFLLYIPPFNPLPGLDTVAIGFSITGVLLLVAMRRYRLLEIMPIVRGILVEKMADGLIVLDSLGRIVDINPAARERFGLGGPVVGSSVRDILPSWAALLDQAAAAEDVTLEARHPADAAVIFDLRVSRFRAGRGGLEGRILVFRDVTDRRNAEMERERLIRELQDAAADIKSLRGLLPICSSCKKIRDDSGYWRHVEDYVAAHSEAQFSHGMCPDCLRRLYPELTEPQGKD
jgi:PAS domain S-box-containing protein